MRKLGIREADIEEKFVRSSGRGGQNVNKVSTCVMLHHRSSGLRVRCSETRSQGDNRFHARRTLCEKLDERILGARSARERERRRIRQQKRKRGKRTKEKLLRLKRERSQKKQLRKSPTLDV